MTPVPPKEPNNSSKSGQSDRPKNSDKSKRLSRIQVRNQLNLIIDLWSASPKSFRKVKLPEPKSRGDSLQDIIDYLRVCVKYSLLDNEASHREIRALTKRLKDLE